MKTILSILAAILIVPTLWSQSNTHLSEGINTYALIIGVSHYPHDSIKNLNFAHKDAEIFANFLTTPNGGSVPSRNIKLLTNRDATISNIYAGMEWLKSQVEENDEVYFYFSGHGDIEKGIFKLGFLLAHDTPYPNYKNNAVRIEDVNILANNLSVVNKANVVIVTDACHAGKLSGSDNLRVATLKEELFKKATQNETRIASCRPSEESQEGSQWGDGRGVFSFYFIQGLQGFADIGGDNNGEVTLDELDKFVSKNVKRDVNRIIKQNQNPVLDGKSDKVLAKVTSLNGVSREMVDASKAISNGKKSMSRIRSAQDEYFDLLNIAKLKEEWDFREVAEADVDQLMDFVLSEFPVESNISDTTNWASKLQSDIIVRNTFKQQLGAEIHNEVQKAIIAYLNGDQDELEKRKFINAENSDFGEYAYMLQTAMNLTPKNSFLYDLMEVKKFYFSGVASRLEISESSNVDSLLEVAFAAQEKALELDGKAAYIHNELGILHTIKEDYSEAIIKFEDAREIALNWPIPLYNLGRIHYLSDDFVSSDSLATMAINMKPNYVYGHLLKGDNALKFKNYVQAKDSYSRAIRFNSNCYLAYQGLAQAFMMSTDYSKANSNFNKVSLIVDSLKDIEPEFDFTFELPVHDLNQIDSLPEERVPLKCDMDNDEIPLEDLLANFTRAYCNYSHKNYDVAKQYFERVIKIDPSEPLAPYYLGRIYKDTGDFVSAEFYLLRSEKLQLSNKELEAKANEMHELRRCDDCDFRNVYLSASYNPVHNKYFLAEVNDSLGHYARVVEIYNEQIEAHHDQDFRQYLIPYKLLWTHYKNRGLYENAENVIQEYSRLQKNDGRKELYAFYKDMIDESIRSLEYEYKAGMLLYSIAKDNSDLIMSGDFSWWPLDHDFDENINLILPGTNFSVRRAEVMTNVCNDAISHLENGMLNKNSVDRGDIHFKLGELYAMRKNWKMVIENYVSANDFSPTHAFSLSELLPHLEADGIFISVYDLLIKMNNKGQVKYDDLFELAELSALASDFEASNALLNRLSNIVPIENPRINEISALNDLLSGAYDEALIKYNNIDESADSKYHLYTLCRINAALGNMAKAERLLKEADNKGFSEYWVLLNDPLIENLRNTELYNEILEKGLKTFENLKKN